MPVWREVRFPTISNSILQTVRKHAAVAAAAALRALGKMCCKYVRFYTSSSNFFRLPVSRKRQRFVSLVEQTEQGRLLNPSSIFLLEERF